MSSWTDTLPEIRAIVRHMIHTPDPRYCRTGCITALGMLGMTCREEYARSRVWNLNKYNDILKMWFEEACWFNYSSICE